MKIKVICNKCGKEPPIDKEKSNKNWVVHNTSKPCGCGGNWRVKV
jgi:hypothetical protein